MLPDTAESVPEIMQTEDTGPDEIPILNPLPDTDMTVQEETDQSLAPPQSKTNTIGECPSADTSFPGVDLCAPILKDAEIGFEVKNPCDKIGPNEESFLRDPTINVRTTSKSLISSLPSISSLSAPYKKEKEKSSIDAQFPSPSPSKTREGHLMDHRSKRRSRWKLKFHHQALPPEYLDHYEATVAQQKAMASREAAGRFDVKGKEDSPPVLHTAGPASTKRAASEKKHAIISSPSDGFIKVEPEISKHAFLPSEKTMNQFHSLPMQTISISDDNDSKDDLLNEINCVNILKSPLNHTHVCDETFFSNKGLLGTLLASTKSSEVTSNSCVDSDKKRNSVIITSSHVKNKISSNMSQISSSTNGTEGQIRSYQDLPYMGEITLNSMKPRRGRKPKKADICHLIYKNYGTTVIPGISFRNDILENSELPATRTNGLHHNSISGSHMNHTDISRTKENSFESSLKCRPECLENSSPASHSDVQNRIISSLLEKRLMTSQEVKKLSFNRPCFKSNSPCINKSDSNPINEANLWSENNKTATSLNDEPLNLCVKDLNQLKIRLLRKHGNFYEPKTYDNAIKSESQSPNSCQETDEWNLNDECSMKFHPETNIFGGSRKNKNELHVETDCRREPFAFSEGVCSRYLKPCLLSGESGASKNISPLSGGCIYWPSAGVFVHPMALQSQFLYYQKMGTIPVVPISPTEPQTFIPPHAPPVNLVSHINTVEVPPAMTLTKPSKKNPQSSITKISIPKTFPMIDSNSKHNSSICMNDSFAKLKRLAPLENTSITSAPAKRKRSAIFIPPIPKENSSNPTTEVSICKFKFTGGAKPSLQEKKMLSVDSGGNFRYYSGTGDKSMRGYEFFPRETLQQTGQAGSSSSEQFLSAYKAGGTERARSTSIPFTNEKKSKQLHFISELAEQSSKFDITNLLPCKPENGSSDYAFLKCDHQNDSRDMCEQNENTSLDRHAGGSLNISRFSSIGKEEEEVTVSNSQVRLRKKRKTRKTLAREKLEQTFKEKGFLIQTQQLESAEGATYCKFRQLRKFTRYLFRSWKDYLPGNVREMSVAAGVAPPEVSSIQGNQIKQDIERELSCSISPASTPQHVSENLKTFPSL